MKFRWDNKYLYWGVTGFVVVAASMLFYFGIFQMGVLIRGISIFLHILMPILYGAAIAYLICPITNFLERKVFFRAQAFSSLQTHKERGALCEYFAFSRIYVLYYLFAADDAVA